MKYVKILGLLAVAATAMMAFAATASAVTLTNGGTVYGGAGKTIQATTEGHAILQNPIAKIECHGKVEGNVENWGAGNSVSGNITSLLWGTQGNLNGACTNSWHVTTVENGKLILHWKASGEGTLTSTGTKVDTTRFGVTCVYKTNNTQVGTFTDSAKTKGTATLHISASIPIDPESSFLCGEGNAKWEGSYKVEAPDELIIDQN